MALQKKAISGMFWVFIDTFLLKGVSFGGTVLLARLLSPNDFGLIAMISVFVAMGAIIVDSGLSSSLIRNVSNDSSDYTTVFYTNCGISLIMYLIFYLLSPYIADFYNRPELVLLIRIYCISFLLTAFSSVQMAILIKKMLFKRMAFLNIPSVFLGNGLGILMGIYGFGVWSIVGMYLFTQFFQALTFWFGSSWKPNFEFSIKKLKYHYNYGNKLLFSSLLTSIFGNIYNIVIGRFYSVKTTGYFDRAFTLNQYPLIILVQVLGRVSLPLLSEIQMDKEKVEIIFSKLINFAFFITAPIMFGISATAKPLILVVLGEKWLPAVPMLQIIGLGGIFYSLQALNVNIQQIYGRSDLILKSEIILKIILLLTVFIAYFFGFYAIVWTVVVNALFTLIFNMYFTSKVINFSVYKQFRSILPIFIISLLMFCFLLLIQKTLYDRLSAFTELLLLFVSGIAFYLIVSFIFKIPTMYLGIEYIKNKKNNIK